MLGECNEDGVSNDSKGCKDSGSHYTYSILLFMILFSSTATLLLIACFAAFRRSPAGMVHNQRFNRGARMPGGYKVDKVVLQCNSEHVGHRQKYSVNLIK